MTVNRTGRCDTDRLRVVTFNIQHGAKGDYGRGYPELVGEACQLLDADIIGMQEVDVGVARSQKANLAAIAAEAAGMNVVFAKARTFRGRGQYGNALLVRGEIRNTEVLKLSGDYHKIKIGKRVFKPLPEPRNAIISDVATGGYEFAVGATHLGGDNRKEQLGHMATSLVRRHSRHILLGDLNLRLTTAQTCVEPYGIELVEGPYTSPAEEPKQQIDHIGLRGFRLCDVYAYRFPISDHLALVAEVEPIPIPALVEG